MCDKQNSGNLLICEISLNIHDHFLIIIQNIKICSIFLVKIPIHLPLLQIYSIKISLNSKIRSVTPHSWPSGNPKPCGTHGKLQRKFMSRAEVF